MTTIFPHHVYAHRLQQAQQHCQTKNIDGLIIGTGSQLKYLTGATFHTHERLAALIIPATGTPTFILPAVDRGDLNHTPIPQLNITTTTWTDGENPYQLVITALPNHPTRIAISPDLTADHLLQLQHLLGPTCETVLATTILAELFICKDEAEITALSAAATAIDKVLNQVPQLLQPGKTENDIANELEKLIRTEHHTVDFIIVGSAENGANPHHDHSNRILQTGDMVVVDIGGTYGPGYHSDCTRTYIVGGPQAATNQTMLNQYQTLRTAQTAALEAIKPGVTAESIDTTARTILENAGLGDYFIHRTGHGIGLSTHEEPFIAQGNTLILEPGMTFSVEPGFYIPGHYGARIEDIVLVTPTGYKTLNNQPRTLQ